MMTSKFVYLAGPIKGCTEASAKNWREYVAEELERHYITAISPLRCEPLVGERYGVGTDDPKFGTARAIMNKNLYDVRACDAVIAYLPDPATVDAEHHSWGTMSELSWARALDKMVILVTDDPRIAEHPVLSASAGWVVKSLDDAIEILAGILGGYTGGFPNV
jgi:nucleoside 2-deoxyribosyltransferase